MIARRAKIVCTIGPASASKPQLQALIERGMNVARLNFSHGDHAQHAAVLADLRALVEALDVPMAILQDLAGPKVRVGTFADGAVDLVPEQSFTLTARSVEGSRERVSVSYAGLPDEVQPGDALLLADGTIELRVEGVTRDDIQCRVIVGGRLGHVLFYKLPEYADAPWRAYQVYGGQPVILRGGRCPQRQPPMTTLFEN